MRFWAQNACMHAGRREPSMRQMRLCEFRTRSYTLRTPVSNCILGRCCSGRQSVPTYRHTITTVAPLASSALRMLHVQCVSLPLFLNSSHACAIDSTRAVHKSMRAGAQSTTTMSTIRTMSTIHTATAARWLYVFDAAANARQPSARTGSRTQNCNGYK